MKLLFDQNLSFRLVTQLAAEFPGAAHVRDVGMSTASDPDVWSFARDGGLTIVSKDRLHHSWRSRSPLIAIVLASRSSWPPAAIAAVLSP